VRFDLARGAAACVHPGFLSGGGQRLIVWICSPARGAAAGDDPPCCRPGFPRDRGGQAVCHQADGTPRLHSVSVAADGIAVSADGRLVYYCPIGQPELVSVDAAVLTDFTQSDAAVAATSELSDKGEVVAWKRTRRGRLSDERGVQRHPAVRSRRRERRTLSTRR